MKFEDLKKEYIKLRKEELKYFDNVINESRNRIFSEKEKLDIYRKANKYEKDLCDLMDKMREQARIEGFYKKYGLYNMIFTFSVDKNLFSNIKSEDYRRHLLRDLYIDIKDYKGKLNMIMLRSNYYKPFNIDRLIGKQELINIPLYLEKWDYDATEDCYGPLIGDYEDYQYVVYDRIDTNCHDIEIKKKEKANYEEGKTILRTRPRVDCYEVMQIFREELLNEENNSIIEVVNKTQERVDKLYEIRTPEYKEQRLLEKVNELYKKVKGKCINKKILYNGKFLDMIKETYELPNGKIVEKEKVIKNNNKNSVIVIALDKDNNYILNFQQRINDKMIAEFPSGFIEEKEGPLSAAKRELEEETGYTSDNMFILDEAYTLPGIENSTVYIVVANNCEKKKDIKQDGTELVSYGIFNKKELRYLIGNNILKGSLSKLAYYSIFYNKEIDEVSINYKDDIEKRNKTKILDL